MAPNRSAFSLAGMTLLQFGSWTLAVLVILLLNFDAISADPPRQPNIVLILADDKE